MPVSSLRLLVRLGLPSFLVVVGAWLVWRTWPVPRAAFPVATATLEPIIPTRTPRHQADMVHVVEGLAVQPTRHPLREHNTAVPPADVLITDIGDGERFGVAVPDGHYFAPAQAAGLRFGSYLNWWPNLPHDDEHHYWRMVRVRQSGIVETTCEELAAVAQENLGAFWLIGNEMDVQWQDNTTPERYAEIYHEVYHFLKAQDPTAKVGIGGVSQSTPLRRAYLDRVLDTYQRRYGRPLPTDFWNVHAFILREEAGSWGADIPPGMAGALGTLYELAEHADIEIWRQNIIDFRLWMRERGYQNRPLVISEYGILMPQDFGYPPEVVADFLEESLDFLTTARDEEIGYPLDDYRLVQWWFWYSVYEDPSRYATGNLYDIQNQRLTLAGQRFATYERR